MVVQELIAKLGFDIDPSALKRVDDALAAMGATASRAVNAVRGVGGAEKQVDSAHVQSTADALEEVAANAEKAKRAIGKLGVGGPKSVPGVPAIAQVGTGPNSSVANIRSVTDALGAQTAQLRAQAAAMRTPEYKQFAAEQRRLKKEIDDTNASLNNQGQSAQKAEGGMASLVRGAALAAAVMYAVKKTFDGIVYAVSEAADLESLNAEFEVMLKNADAAKYLVQEIQAFAAATPFETKGLVENTRLIMAFGESADSALKAVKMLGDVAGSDQEKLNRLSLAYAQVMSAGKLQGQDLLQFVNAGFNPLKELSRMTGKSMADLRKEMEKGLITSDMVKQAFVSATGPGGLFFGNMEKQSQTLNGLWSTLKDNFNIMIQNLGTLLIPAIKAVIIAFLPLMDDIAGAYRQLSDFFLVFFENGPEAGNIASFIAATIMTIADAIMTVMAFTQALWVVFEALGTGISLIVGGIYDAIMSIPKALAYVRKGLAKILIGVGMASGNKTLTSLGASWERSEDEKIGGGMFAGVKTAWATGTAGESYNKLSKMASMIGQTKAAPEGTKAKLSDGILEALQGKTPVSVTNNNQSIHNNVTVNAADDTLKTAAESLFGKAFQSQLIQLRAATV